MRVVERTRSSLKLRFETYAVYRQKSPCAHTTSPSLMSSGGVRMEPVPWTEESNPTESKIDPWESFLDRRGS